MTENQGVVQKDAVIIGGGLGGLQCGYILAKNGMDVCVLEKNPLPGGCLQSYRRKGAEGVLEFDAGMHYVGGLDEGQPLNSLFRYFGLLDLPWEKMDPQAFEAPKTSKYSPPPTVGQPPTTLWTFVTTIS